MSLFQQFSFSFFSSYNCCRSIAGCFVGFGTNHPADIVDIVDYHSHLASNTAHCPARHSSSFRHLDFIVGRLDHIPGLLGASFADFAVCAYCPVHLPCLSRIESSNFLLKVAKFDSIEQVARPSISVLNSVPQCYCPQMQFTLTATISVSITVIKLASTKMSYLQTNLLAAISITMYPS